MSNSPPASKARSTFRPEIQGLRAVASLLVAIFHIWLGRVSGGVDVFIVVSGFLITTSLLSQVERTGRVRFVEFWGGLIKRLLPAALFVLSAVIVGTILWLPKLRWVETLKEIVASAAYMENWQLAFNAVDYLARDNAISPLQHYWALSVQGQFYLLWPLLVTVALLLAGRSALRTRPMLRGVLGAVFAVSLAYSVYATAVNQPFAYFNTFARAWEFALGGLLAATLPLLNPGKTMRLLCGWVGLLAILSCGLVLQVSTVFPGYAALWPTLGAALVLIAGTSGSLFGADRLLASAPFQYLGDRSYSLYLWHWPILVFYRQIAGQTALSLTDGLIVLAISIVLAILTTRFVENPARFSKVGKQQPWRALAFGAACAAPLMLVVALWAAYILRAQAYDRRALKPNDPSYPGAMALIEGFQYHGERNVPFYPGPFAVKDDLPDLYADKCHQTLEDAAALSCEYGDKRAPATVALVGGSHAAQWLPALQVIARQYPLRIVTFTKSSCLFTTDSGDPSSREDVSCAQWNENVLTELLNMKPAVVFTTSTRGSGRSEEVPRGYLEQWRKLAVAGIRVLAVRDNPWMSFEVAECVELHGPTASRCARPRHQMLARVNPVQQYDGELPNVRFVDLSDFFCNESVCLPVAGNVLIYRDQHHITATYARTLAPMLRSEVLTVATQDRSTDALSAAHR